MKRSFWIGTGKLACQNDPEDNADADDNDNHNGPFLCFHVSLFPCLQILLEEVGLYLFNHHSLLEG